MFSVKTLVLFTLATVVFAAAKSNRDEENKKYTDICLKKTDMERAEFDQALRVPIASVRIQCFVKCLAVEYGIVDEDGKIVQEKMEDFLVFLKTSDKDKPAAKECLANIPVIKECEDVPPFAKCLIGSVPWTSYAKN